MEINQCHSHNGSNSSYSLLSENMNEKLPASGEGTSQHLEMLKANVGQTTDTVKISDDIVKLSGLGCEGKSICCMSKADEKNYKVDYNGETDQKSMTGSSSSVNSLCQKCSDKLVDIQSAKHGSIRSEYIAEEGNKPKGSPEYAREAPESAADSKQCSHDPIDIMKSDTEVDENRTSSVALTSMDQKEHIGMGMAYALQEPPLQYYAMASNENLDELVDVRVCDICGDAGREAMLAICSKCSDGAEHVYCMRVKMDKVPEDDWICEECMIVAEAHNQKADEQKIDEALQNTSPMVPQSLRQLDRSDNGRVGVDHASLASSGKRPGENLQNSSSSTKKRKLDKGVKLWSPPGSGAKGALLKHANLKIMPKGKVVSSLSGDSLGNILQKACQPLAGKSSNSESQFHKGSLFKQTCSTGAVLRTGQKFEDVYKEQKTPKGSPTIRPELRNAELRKSQSFAASKVASLDTSGSGKNLRNDSRIPKVGSKLSLSQRSYSFNSKILQSVPPLGSSSISRIKPAKAALAQAEVKKQVPQRHPDRKIAEVHKDMEKDYFHRVAKRQCDKNAYAGLPETMTRSTAAKERSPQNFVRTINGCLSQKADKETANMKPEPVSKYSKLQLYDTIQLKRSSSWATAHLADFVHPSVDCVWRGIFNVKGFNKLPVSCTLLQAHMSSCASPKAYQVVSKFPREMKVEEVLQRDILPAQFMENFATEDNIALYFFPEDLQSYQSYKRFLNCMMLNKLALKSNLDDVELLIFPSQILPARSQRWNNLFFLWGVFRAKKLRFHDDACVPSHLEATRICQADIFPNSPPSLDSPKSKCLEGSSFSEVDDEMMARALIMLKEQHSGGSQTKNKAKEENKFQNQDLEVKTVDTNSPSISASEIPTQPTSGAGKDTSNMAQRKLEPNIDLNYPHNELSSPISEPLDGKELPEYDIITDGGSFSLNSGPSDSGGAETSEKATLNLNLSLWPEREHTDVSVSLDLSLALPSKDDNPAPVPETSNVDTSMFMFFRR